MFCRHCGQVIDDDSRFCAVCGGNQAIEPMTEQPEITEQPMPMDDMQAQDEAAGGETAQQTPTASEEPPRSAQESLSEEAAQEMLIEPELLPEDNDVPFAMPAAVPFGDVSADGQDVFEHRFAPAAGLDKPGGRFLADWLSLIIVGVMLIGLIIFGGASGYLFAMPYLENLLARFIPIGLIAFAAVITTRAKGPDLSIGAVMSLGAMLFVVGQSYSGSVALGLLVALLACAVVGIINGVLSVLLRIPAVIATVLVAAIIGGVGAIFSWAATYSLPAGLFAMDNMVIALIALAAALVVCFLVVMLTKLGKPMGERDADDERNPSFFGAYVLSALIAGTAGFVVLIGAGAAPPIAVGSKMIVVLLFFGIVMSNRRTDNRFYPILYALLAAVVYTMLVDVFELYQLPRIVELLSISGLALAFVIIAYVTRKGTAKDIMLYQ